MAAGSGTVTVKILGDASSYKKAVAESEEATEGIGSKLAKIGAAVGGVIAVKEGFDFLKDSMKDAADEAKDMAVLSSTLKTAGHATDGQVASTEAWITKMQNATGILDDELRPALGKLVIAGRSISDAEKDMGVAADIAAARHLDLGTVVQAMSKAAGGSTGALGKLGIATKDAAGHALSYNDILKEASKTMGGTAAAAADTAAGRAAILSAKFKDLKEQIGTFLLPIMDLFTSKLSAVIGFVSNLAAEISENGLGNTLADLGNKFEAAWPGIQIGLENVWAKLVAWIQLQVPVIADQLSAWAESFIAWIEPLIPPFLAELGKLLLQLDAWFVNVALPAILEKLGEWAVSFVEWIGPAIPPMLVELVILLGQLGDWMSNVALPAIVKKLASWAGAFVGWVGQAILDLPGKLGPLGDAVVSFVAGLPGRITSAARGMWDGIAVAFKSAINSLLRGWNGLQFKIPGFKIGPVGYDGFTLGVPDVPYLAAGGIVTRPTLAMIGEAGPEAVVPLGRAGWGGGGSITTVINIDGVEVARAIRKANADRDRRNGF